MVIGISENYTVELLDIADELLIINKRTIDTLMELDNASDCIALYVFYYKTAKWQKTNQIKATDTYAMKCLGWGNHRLLRTKDTLKAHGLIDIVQTRGADGTIKGWYIKLHYIVAQRELSDCKVSIQKCQNPLVDSTTCGKQKTNALRLNNKCLKTEFETLWKLYPNKRGKDRAFNSYVKARKEGTTPEEVEAGIKAYAAYVIAEKTEMRFVKHGSTFFSQKCWEDDWSTGTPTLSKLPTIDEKTQEEKLLAFDEIQRREREEWETQHQKA